MKKAVILLSVFLCAALASCGTENSSQVGYEPVSGNAVTANGQQPENAAESVIVQSGECCTAAAEADEEVRVVQAPGCCAPDAGQQKSSCCGALE